MNNIVSLIIWLAVSVPATGRKYTINISFVLHKILDVGYW